MHYLTQDTDRLTFHMFLKLLLSATIGPLNADHMPSGSEEDVFFKRFLLFIAMTAILVI